MKFRKLLLACALTVGFSHAHIRAEDTAPLAPTIWFRAQVAHPQELLTRTVAHARNIHPHPSLHMLPTILLGAWGYPDFHGLSQETPITVTFFRNVDDEHGLDWVARAKFTDSSSISPVLEMQGLKSKKAGIWTIIGRSEEILSHAEGQLDTLFSPEVPSPMSPSVSIQLMDQYLKSLIREFEGTALQNIAHGRTLEGNMPALSVLNLVLNLARQIDNMECQLGVSGENFEIQFSLHAAKNSDLAMLFAAPAENGEIAKLETFLPPDGEVRWLCKSNPNVTKFFVHHLLDALFIYNESHPITDTSDRDIYNFFDSVWSLCGGSAVAQASFSADGNLLLYKLWAAALSPDQLGIWVDFVYNKVVPIVIGEAAKMFWGGEIALDTKAVPKAFAYKKHTISRANIKLDLKDGDTVRHQYEKSYYYCAFGNFVAVTNSKKSMRHLIDEMANGNLPRPPENAVPLDNATVFRFQSDYVPQPQKRIFPPLDITTKFEDGTAIFKMNINSKLLGKWLQDWSNNSARE
ncbi:MAG: hypothetical protein LBB26_02350 [Puniceicoccales bacterium]|jgi:hypothetical protein|nr:hypothetical protein [Puniceicoccales bacterium]